MMSLLGNNLCKPDGSTVATDAALQGKTVLGLYFSAHWCGPCRGFTPTLTEKYTALTAAHKNFELVFISSDKDESAFSEYHKSMNFLALPFAERKTKAALSKKFKVQGIPTLVFYDLEADKVITADGREAVSDDDFVKSFPYRPEPFSISSLGNEFRLPGGGKGDASLLNVDVVGLYFSAHWCPPCRGFTPTLSDNYTALKKAGKSFELFFVSSDRDDAAFTEYSDSMTFPALPFAQRDLKNKLSKICKVQGIPSLVLFDAKTGDIITDSARGAISSDSFIEDFPYYPKPMYDLEESADGINGEVSLVVLMEKVPAEKQAVISKALLSLAEEELKKPEDARRAGKFFTGKTGSLPNRIRGLCKMPEAAPDATMVLLDLDDEGSYYFPEGEVKEVTAVSMGTFLDDFKAEKLKKLSLS